MNQVIIAGIKEGKRDKNTEIRSRETPHSWQHARAPSLLYTLIWSLLTTLDCHVQIGRFVSIVQVLDEPAHIVRSLKFFST